ncbi:hypothetical protein VPH35_005459 [Triticum aestivum]
MPTVKVLAIEYDGPNLDTLIGLLKCFPCLERLYVIFNARSRMKIESVQKYGPLDPIECLESYLKRVVLEGYSGDKPNVEFAKFFVLNAKVLEEMKFGSIHSRDREWKSNQHMWLLVDSRASRDARFEFTSRYCRHNGLGNSHTHDYQWPIPSSALMLHAESARNAYFVSQSNPPLMNLCSVVLECYPTLVI